MLRFTLIFEMNVDAKVEEAWWPLAMDKLPDKDNSDRKAGVRFEEGPGFGGRVVLSRTPSRFDWVILPAEGPETAERLTVMPDVDLTQTLNDGLGGMLKWLPRAPYARRLAVGSSLLVIVPDQKTAIGVLAAQMRDCLQLDPETCSEFHYQINRHRISGAVESLRINRLAKWSLATLTRMTGTVGAPAPDAVQQLSLAAGLDLDLNTAPEYPGSFDPESAERVFRELVSFAVEIADKGDKE